LRIWWYLNHRCAVLRALSHTSSTDSMLNATLWPDSLNGLKAYGAAEPKLWPKLWTDTVVSPQDSTSFVTSHSGHIQCSRRISSGNISPFIKQNKRSNVLTLTYAILLPRFGVRIYWNAAPSTWILM
jgi:hypothetical protein